MTTNQDIAAVSQPDALLPMPDPPEHTWLGLAPDPGQMAVDATTPFVAVKP